MVFYATPEEAQEDLERIREAMGPMEYDPVDAALEDWLVFGSDEEDREYYKRVDRAEWARE